MRGEGAGGPEQPRGGGRGGRNSAQQPRRRRGTAGSRTVGTAGLRRSAEETALSGARLSRGQPQPRGRERRRPAPTSSRCPPRTAGPALNPRGEGPSETEKKRSRLSYPAPLTGPPAPAVPHRQRVPAAGCPAPGTPRPGAARLGHLLPFLLPLPSKAPPAAEERPASPEDFVPSAGTPPSRPVPEGFTKVPLPPRQPSCSPSTPRTRSQPPLSGPGGG